MIYLRIPVSIHIKEAIITLTVPNPILIS